MNPSIPAGRVAFYISPDDHEIHYSVVKVRGRYVDEYDVLELPRGEPDDFYVNRNLAPTDPNYRVVVERSKEHNTLKRLGIEDAGDPLAILAAHGYAYERTESLEEAGKRELKEEHGFDDGAHLDMVRQLITMRPFPVKANYGSPVEYRSFVQIEGDVSSIALAKTDKVEKKSPKRLGAPYTEAGGWATLREIRQNAADFAALAEADESPEQARLRGEAAYQKSITDWMETAEAALVATLRRQRVEVQTTSIVDPAKALQTTDAAVSSGAELFR
ncbi:MAG: hypothetical protein SFT92_08625 [Rickettsiales bacterium]|nr:hypothetical protein [Rickettsiales bacterium]